MKLQLFPLLHVKLLETMHRILPNNKMIPRLMAAWNNVGFFGGFFLLVFFVGGFFFFGGGYSVRKLFREGEKVSAAPLISQV